MGSITTSGNLVVSVYQNRDLSPISGAQVEISDMNGNIIKRLQTDEFGNIQTITLPALSNHNTRSEIAMGDEATQGKYIVTVKHPNYEPVRLEGVRIVEGSKAIPEIHLSSLRGEGLPVIKTLKLEDPKPPIEKIDQNPYNLSELSTNPQSFVNTLNFSIEHHHSAHHHSAHPPIGLVIPETIRVHLFPEEGSNAPGRTIVVKFVDYIKGVVHQELDGFTEDEAIRANIIAIVSFTLNRYYTSHYNKQNKNYHITNDRTVDPGYIERPTDQEPLVRNTDAFFSQYVEYPNHRYFPFLTQYCNSSCANEGKLDKAQSRILAQEGKKHTEIIKYFYGENYNTVSAAFIIINNELYTFISPMKLGDSGGRVLLIQTYLDVIGKDYGIQVFRKAIEENGQFGEKTVKAIKLYQQKILNWSSDKITGVVDQATWYKILTRYFIIIYRLPRNYYPNDHLAQNRPIRTTNLQSIQPGYMRSKPLFLQYGLLCKTIPIPYGSRQYCYYSYFYELYNPYMYASKNIFFT
ncbi:hypothetical protein CN533_05065 [Priestia megaterium]|uniref:SpoIID/LytB domain-containing protein n=1 Tax=Priestia megaterium TaxID=1404 RepID=UPI000BF78288|nr:SpoIID/LytB domain-containing protein [Priestia megaterium]PET72775.1 hypothetical protein CN533_05065 [Priestia megaterium]PFK88895.1 hypothetical protein COJ19_04355 [Priestia megaterium]